MNTAKVGGSAGTTVMWRNSAGLKSPGCATQFHFPRELDDGRTVAMCSSRIVLDERNACTVAEADDLLCKRCAAIAI